MKITRILMTVIGMAALLFFASCDKGGKKMEQQQVLNFSLIDVEPTYSSDEVQYDVLVFFTMPVEEEDALKIFASDFVRNYEVTPHYLGDRKYNFQINNIKRGNQTTTVEMVLDGKPLKSKSKATRSLEICAKDEFKVADLKVDKEQGSATLVFTQPLKQHNIDGFLVLEPKMGYRSEIVGNKIVLYFDKSNVYSYQLEDVTLTVGSGIKDADGNSLYDPQTFTFDLTDLKPKVRWTEKGVIVPEVGEATIYFDAICLNSVTLRVVKVFNDNILSFYQDNDLEEVGGIRKAGRLVKKVSLALDNPTPNQWKTFPITLSDYVDVKAGDMYQLILDFGPADYAFATDESKQLTLEDEALEARYWDGEAYSFKQHDYEGDWDDPLALVV